MADLTPLQGELQAQIMSALWRLDSGTVEQVRGALPARYRGAYTTVQTVLNRLADRGLLVRKRAGRGFVYTPKVSEAEYLSQAIRHTLAGSTTHARQAALASIIGDLKGTDVAELERLAGDAGKARARDRR